MGKLPRFEILSPHTIFADLFSPHPRRAFFLDDSERTVLSP